MTSREQQKVLLGLLDSPREGLRIGICPMTGRWTLATGSGDSYEELIKHEDWDEFVRLCSVVSDYVPSES